MRITFLLVARMPVLTEVKNPNMGRPTSYDPKYCQEMLDFFKRDFTQEKNGKIEAVDFPSIAGFAVEIGVAKSSLYEWAKKHPDFSNVLARCKDVQENILLNNSLKGGYNAGFAQFLLKNTHGFKEKSEVSQSTKVEITIDDDESKL